MNEAFKNWLPITNRNRVALFFSFLGLLMFVTWNCLPFYSENYTNGNPRYGRDGFIFMEIWPEVIDPDHYLRVIKSPDVDGFLSVAASAAIIMNGLIVLMLPPLWKMLHASAFLRLPVAFVNLIGGGVVTKYFFESLGEPMPPYICLTLLLIALTLFAVSIAMFLFKNELELRSELEMKKTMGGE